MKPIAWKFNDPIEDARWVFHESDLTRIELGGQKPSGSRPMIVQNADKNALSTTPAFSWKIMMLRYWGGTVGYIAITVLFYT